MTWLSLCAQLRLVSQSHLSGQSDKIAAVTRRTNTLMVFVIMTALVVLGVPLAGLILGPNEDQIQPTTDSPTAEPSVDETSDSPEC